MRATALVALGLAAVIALAPASAVLAQTSTQRVTFPAGSEGTTLGATITGDEAVRYLLGARAGQRLEVEMTTSNASANFNITAPGATEALHIGSVAGTSFDGILPAGGDYRVDVFLMRNAARRGETAAVTLTFRISGTGATGEVQPDFADGLMGGPDFRAVTGLSAGGHLNLRAGPSADDGVVGHLTEGAVVRNLGCRMAAGQRWCQVDTGSGAGWAAGQYLRESAAPRPAGDTSAPVAGQPRGNGAPFTATGTLPCARDRGQPMGQCVFGVIRTGPGGASLWVAFPDGGGRAILFEGGAPVFTDAADPVVAELQDDLHLIRIGDERFEVPQAAIDGG